MSQRWLHAAALEATRTSPGPGHQHSGLVLGALHLVGPRLLCPDFLKCSALTVHAQALYVPGLSKGTVAKRAGFAPSLLVFSLPRHATPACMTSKGSHLMQNSVTCRLWSSEGSSSIPNRIYIRPSSSTSHSLSHAG